MRTDIALIPVAWQIEQIDRGQLYNLGGRRYLILGPAVQGRPIKTAQPSADALLTPREREVARLVAAGLPNKQIADTLNLSEWTVASYLRRIFAKLSVRSRAAMVARLLNDVPG
jgi:DNA-binding CsgD family transcriptional regulator